MGRPTQAVVTGPRTVSIISERGDIMFGESFTEDVTSAVLSGKAMTVVFTNGAWTLYRVEGTHMSVVRSNPATVAPKRALIPLRKLVPRPPAREYAPQVHSTGIIGSLMSAAATIVGLIIVAVVGFVIVILLFGIFG